LSYPSTPELTNLFQSKQGQLRLYRNASVACRLLTMSCWKHLFAAPAPFHKNQGSGVGQHVASLKKDFSKMTITPSMSHYPLSLFKAES
jgi:hypothetical protein